MTSRRKEISRWEIFILRVPTRPKNYLTSTEVNRESLLWGCKMGMEISFVVLSPFSSHHQWIKLPGRLLPSGTQASSPWLSRGQLPCRVVRSLARNGISKGDQDGAPQLLLSGRGLYGGNELSPATCLFHAVRRPLYLTPLPYVPLYSQSLCMHTHGRNRLPSPD